MRKQLHVYTLVRWHDYNSKIMKEGEYRVLLTTGIIGNTNELMTFFSSEVMVTAIVLSGYDGL